jgi:hypothetical protein
MSTPGTPSRRYNCLNVGYIMRQILCAVFDLHNQMRVFVRAIFDWTFLYPVIPSRNSLCDYTLVTPRGTVRRQASHRTPVKSGKQARAKTSSGAFVTPRPTTRSQRQLRQLKKKKVSKKARARRSRSSRAQTQALINKARHMRTSKKQSKEAELTRSQRLVRKYWQINPTPTNSVRCVTSELTYSVCTLCL